MFAGVCKIKPHGPGYDAFFRYFLPLPVTVGKRVARGEAEIRCLLPCPFYHAFPQVPTLILIVGPTSASVLSQILGLGMQKQHAWFSLPVPAAKLGRQCQDLVALPLPAAKDREAAKTKKLQHRHDRQNDNPPAYRRTPSASSASLFSTSRTKSIAISSSSGAYIPLSYTKATNQMCPAARLGWTEAAL